MFPSDADWVLEPNTSTPKTCSFVQILTSVFLVLGNNDISHHPTKNWIVPESPRNTAAKLYAFGVCLMDEKTDTRVVGLMPRPDVNYDIVKQSNDYRKKIAWENFCWT